MHSNTNPSPLQLATVISVGLAKKPLLGAAVALLLLLLTAALSSFVVTDTGSAYQSSIPLLSWVWLTIATYYLWHWIETKF